MARGNHSEGQYRSAVKRLEDQRLKQREVDLRELLRHDWGERLAYFVVFELGRLESRSFVAGQPDVTARNEGIREVAEEFKRQLMDADPEGWFHMLLNQVRTRKADLELAQREDESARKASVS